jgi:ubiquinone/menaquinone biosynthesis C-methylase UbiE
MVRVLRPGGRLVITDMDEHPYSWLKDEMADVWQGFERGQARDWFKEAGLVNVIVDCTGQSCCAESANPALSDAQGREAKISVFVATGSRRMVMRDAVQNNYAAVATSGSSCGCSAQASENESCCGSTSGSGSCCSGTSYEDVSFTTGYTPVELSSAPKEAADISLGCGNPIALAGLQADEVVLDIGSGGGLDAFLAAKKVGPGGRVIGVDMTPAMLERARSSAEKNHIPNVEFRQGYAEELPVENGSVDVIISNCVINLTEDKGQVFREAFRVLKPGGRLEVSDMVTSGPVPTELKESAQGWSECVTGALPEKEYLDLMAQAGFESITTRRSASMGEGLDLSIYSVIASARKPGESAVGSSSCGCGQSSDCGCK